jgi:hypothetical protein
MKSPPPRAPTSIRPAPIGPASIRPRLRRLLLPALLLSASTNVSQDAAAETSSAPAADPVAMQEGLRPGRPGHAAEPYAYGGLIIAGLCAWKWRQKQLRDEVRA